MSSLADRFNNSHRSDYDVLDQTGKNIDRFNRHWLSSFLSSVNGGSSLETYIRARLTNRATTRILLDEQYYEQEKAAIAEDVKNAVVQSLRSITKI